jgi:MFS family permease
MMGGVNTAYDYYTLMGFGHKGADGGPVVDDTLLQGGIVSVYYLGTLVGCLIGGSIGDRYGRIKTLRWSNCRDRWRDTAVLCDEPRVDDLRSSRQRMVSTD